MAQFIQRIPRGVSIGIIAALVALVALTAVMGDRFLFGAATGKTTTHPLTVATVSSSSQGTVFTLDDSGTVASFTIHEVLFGQPNTVVGKTSQVSGQVSVNQQDPALSRVGEIRIDVSTLVTDNDLRNNIIRTRILESDQSANQYATFVPTSLKGLQTTPLAYGQQITFEIVGKLTIHQVTQPATFTAKATLVNATTLTGTAQTTIKYADYGITIPSVPSVTGVPDTVVLALTFTAHS
ncbi:MAG TPA: YceI family protein [Ktedonobacterales bacterium]|nr:YceI family protein [Ktedonobacterales bacterium]